MKISIFSRQFFIVTLFLFSIFILYFLFSIKTGPIVSVIRFGLILMVKRDDNYSQQFYFIIFKNDLHKLFIKSFLLHDVKKFSEYH